eukprot:TRINITY_DN371_c0_g1_i1.p1 TRINITY_DN371_c0_g1~~TRINITY_DN371_c0_g1_i1.p1  ORF type:complete len:92 (-),score=6.96 TRINITY_DN371_c0_g1_i1:5-280(-)
MQTRLKNVEVQNLCVVTSRCCESLVVQNFFDTIPRIQTKSGVMFFDMLDQKMIRLPDWMMKNAKKGTLNKRTSTSPTRLSVAHVYVPCTLR